MSVVDEVEKLAGAATPGGGWAELFTEVLKTLELTGADTVINGWLTGKISEMKAIRSVLTQPDQP